MTPEQLRKALTFVPPQESGEFDLNPDRRHLMSATPKEAAVLVPILDHGPNYGSALTVLFTRRTETLSSHAGQVSFPGGRIDPGDASPGDAALREAHEEIGLPASHVDLIGALPSYQTGSGYRIQPIVGLVAPDFSRVPQPAEVAEIFELSLADVLNPANHQIETRTWKDMDIRFYVIPVGGQRVWGATAAILVSLSRQLGLRS